MALNSDEKQSVCQNVIPQVSREHWAAFAGALGLAILLRLILFQGYQHSDPSAYTSLADEMARGVLHVGDLDYVPAIFPLRFGVYAPTAFLFKTFGLSEATLAVFPFLISIGNCLLAYVIARQLFGPMAGLISIVILAILPLDISMASTLLPDAIAAFWANLGMALVIINANKDEKIHTILFPILAGVCFGVSWLCKETVAYLSPVVAIYYLLKSRSISSLVSLTCVGIGALSILVAEAAFYRATAGDWLFHLRALDKNYAQNFMWIFNQSSPYFGWNEGGYAKALANRLLFDGPRSLLTAFSNLPSLAFVALAWGILIKDRRFRTIGVWFVVLVLMFNFASSSLTSYQPLPTFERYLYPLVLPATVLVSGALATLIESDVARELAMERRFWAITAGAIYFLFCAPGVLSLRSRPEQGIRDVLAVLKPSDIVYTDSRTAASMVFFRNGKLLPSTDKTIPYETTTADTIKTGSYILLNKSMVNFLEISYGYNPPAFVHAPPKTWTQVWSDKQMTLFRVD
jgi:dolichyl-phosphate-mannose-protein mannosyltransferase